MIFVNMTGAFVHYKNHACVDRLESVRGLEHVTLREKIYMRENCFLPLLFCLFSHAKASRWVAIGKFSRKILLNCTEGSMYTL
jgi:hypothetical protein